MHKLTFYVPETDLDSVKAALFDVGLGTIGNYEQCCWQVLGQGQFKPQKESQPFLGTRGTLERVNEYRVEMICPDNLLVDAVKALRVSHPYETPAFDFIQLVDVE